MCNLNLLLTQYDQRERCGNVSDGVDKFYCIFAGIFVDHLLDCQCGRGFVDSFLFSWACLNNDTRFSKPFGIWFRCASKWNCECNVFILANFVDILIQLDRWWRLIFYKYRIKSIINNKNHSIKWKFNVFVIICTFDFNLSRRFGISGNACVFGHIIIIGILYNQPSNRALHIHFVFW